MRKPWCWAVFVVLAAATGQVLAWNDVGHMLMARITFENLSETQRAALGGILSAHPRFAEDFEGRVPPDVRRSGEAEPWRFARAATWPDTARHFGYVRPARVREALVERYHRGPWHYINLELRVDAQGSYQEAAGAYQAAAGAYQAEGTEDIVVTLDRISRSWATDSGAQRAVALCWLLHLMGDIHQPLHTVMLIAPGTLEQGDRGGNEVRVRAGRPGPRNLHALWDGALGKSMRWQDLTALARRMQPSASMPTAPNADAIDFAGWAEQGRALARELVYVSGLRRRVAGQSSRGESPDFRPDDAYLKRMTDQGRSQIILAARRAVRVLGTLEPR